MQLENASFYLNVKEVVAIDVYTMMTALKFNKSPLQQFCCKPAVFLSYPSIIRAADGGRNAILDFF